MVKIFLSQKEGQSKVLLFNDANQLGAVEPRYLK